ncbi:bifunctional GTP diphosphokinase/guanosine-3',5'-bis pyrophosphate 3'-pyrophosphohydrolase [Psychrosphaera ytuae]|uniref:guanosine-3',5'-bis(diphosphate) 3'-diphosphatase n=1 Tax=Psychrosphaera ytuae TaxID=2820710 RepID=A0A975HHL8_9GAMM|nr:bifunctional GTP diphosphokinase/guanosine-3',5'-bis pyrophosphate 3'-pyrophosphohydrolase [Psychrosphaera ytuae]QTH63270.1 bifunctional GTP diphosphokinase/guanosine-3',5'-bis pyrophosphate 3'-pyrophosphohydrolase [Psychrosphaera ytuae]
MYLFEGLKQQISAYLPADQVAIVQRAYVVARDAHEGQMRSSGDPYITHPVAVTALLANMKLDHETLAAALMHDVIEDTPVSKKDLADEFGDTIADLVEGVSKLDKLKFKDKKEFQAENFRKMVMAMTQDIRVILIKLADRTHNMRTLGALRPDKKRRIAKETLEIYAPIANRLGIHEFKNELENLGFEALYPMRSRALAAAVKQARGNRKEVIQNIQTEIETRLEEVGISGEVLGREKHLYSIYRKMLNKELMFNEVMDIYAFRIIVDNVDTCYRVFGVMHNLYKPIETRFKDYIAIPKSNGYQSLHTSLIGPHGIPIEIQIRTHDMEQLADRGIAAHWQYKGAGESKGNTAQTRARQWMQTLLELQQSAGSSFEFIENVKTEMFPEEIYVFTPDGKIHELPMGATPVDFAYSVHTDVGNTCVGAKVDRKPHPLSKPLDTGQTVEIMTSPNVKPNANWLNFVVTAKARLGIRNYLKHQRTNEAINLGRRLLNSALAGVSIEDIEPTRVNKLLDDFHLDSLEDLHREIGLGNLMGLTISNRLLNSDEPTSPSKEDNVPIAGAKGMLVTYSKCCHPIHGDEIVAHVSQGKGLTVHREDCPNCRGWEKDAAKFFKLKWDENSDREYVTTLKIELINHQGALAKVTHLISLANSNVEHIFTEEKESNIYVITADVSVKNRVHLARVIKKIRTMPDVQRVHRK